jgi:hypothetical protein
MLGPSWNAPIGALPHDDRAGTHDSADGHCGWYASIGRGQAALLWITLKVENVCKNPKAGGIEPRLLAGFDAESGEQLARKKAIPPVRGATSYA